MDVYIVWHVRHARSLDGSPTQHLDVSGDVLIDQEFDDVKLIGVYSDEPAVRDAIGRARLRKGSRDEPDCFTSSAYTVGEDHWTDGFVTIPVTED